MLAKAAAGCGPGATVAAPKHTIGPVEGVTDALAEGEGVTWGDAVVVGIGNGWRVGVELGALSDEPGADPDAAPEGRTAGPTTTGPIPVSGEQIGEGVGAGVGVVEGGAGAITNPAGWTPLPSRMGALGVWSRRSIERTSPSPAALVPSR